jgi:hypothetical protein
LIIVCRNQSKDYICGTKANNMKRFELLPVKQKDSKIEGYYIWDNQNRTYWTDHKNVNYYTTSKRTATEIVNALNAQ